jgi:hypothetical protein
LIATDDYLIAPPFRIIRLRQKHAPGSSDGL